MTSTKNRTPIRCMIYCLTILSSVLLVLPDNGFSASKDDPKSCQKQFELMGRVINSLEGVLTQQAPFINELKRIDLLLYSEIEKATAHLPVERQNRLLKLVKEVETKENALPAGQEGGVIIPKDGKVHLFIPEKHLSHPYGRIILRHEFSHLTRVDMGDVAPGVAFKAIQKRKNNSRSWSKDEETQAFSDQYDFIRKIYRPEDLHRLKQEFPVSLT